MCGISGYTGYRKVHRFLIQKLKLLEYRGYDSTGIASVSTTGGFLAKEIGDAQKLQKSISEDRADTCGIGHTRWATHGQANRQNAHPHSDCNNEIFVCHNGIVQNYAQLRTYLKQNGHILRSDTDSQVIPHLFQQFYEGDLVTAFRKTISMLRGQYAVVLIHCNFPELILAARHKSPVVIGFGKMQTFVSSDIPTLLSQTNSFYDLKEQQLAIVSPTDCQLYDLNGNPRPITRIIRQSQAMHISREGFDHFMLKEIWEEPKAVRSAVIQPEKLLQAVQYYRKSKRLVLVACGSSYYACLYGKMLLEYFGLLSEVHIGSQFIVSGIKTLTDDCLVIAVSQSGETADTKYSVEMSKAKGAKIISIVNVDLSSIVKLADLSILTKCGVQIGVASTKSFVGQLTVLGQLCLAFAKERQKISEIQFQTFKTEIKQIPSKIQEILANSSSVKQLASQLLPAHKFFFLGKRVGLPVVLQSALKIKEIAYVHAEAFPSGQLKHGPLALLDSNSVVFTVFNDSQLTDKLQNAVDQCRARKARVICVGQKGEIRLPDVSMELSPLMFISWFHLFSYYFSLAKGNHPDRPRNLAKSVVVS